MGELANAQQKQAAKWEYGVFTAGDAESLATKLNEKAAEGWEYIDSAAMTGGPRFTAILRRERA